MIDLSAYRVILASRSPGRQELLKGLGIPFEVRLKDTPESYDPDLSGKEIATELAVRKNFAFSLQELPENFLLITADTIVWLNGKVLNKPADERDAIEMLTMLSGNEHMVYTGVCLRSAAKTIHFCAESRVRFSQISIDEIQYYVKNFKPFDKAGSYGVQEWIGYVAIEHIEGSYFNVMGLPTQMLYLHLKAF